MIRDQALRKLSKEWNIRLIEVEKHYVLGWILYGVVKSTIAENLVFKGGTALSKIFYPSDWRLSEDLDFSISGEIKWSAIIKALDEEVPKIVRQASGMELRRRENPHTNDGYLQYKIGYTGPVGRGFAKVEITREKFVGEVITGEVRNVPAEFDYEEFSLKTYSLETLMGEKIRAIIERGYVRDYYDVWRLLKEKRFDRQKVVAMFNEKCRAKGMVFSSMDQFFPEEIVGRLAPHLEDGLLRLSRAPLPPLETMMDELRNLLGQLLL